MGRHLERLTTCKVVQLKRAVGELQTGVKQVLVAGTVTAGLSLLTAALLRAPFYTGPPLSQLNWQPPSCPCETTLETFPY